MTRYGGLHLEQNKLRLAIFEGTPKKFELVDFIDEDIESEAEVERIERARAVLGEVLDKKENRGMEIVASLDSRLVTLREISVPFTRDDQIAKTVRFEAEGYIHSHSIDDVVIEHLKCSETEDSSRLLICAAPKDEIRARLDELKTFKIDPVVMELDATAAATAFASTPVYSEDQNVLLISVDAGAVRFVFLEKGKIVKIRSVWSDAGLQSDESYPLDGSSVEAAGPVEAPVEESPDPAAAASPPSASDSNPERWADLLDEEPGAAPDEDPDEISRRFEEIERSLEDRESEGEAPAPFVVLSDDAYQSLRGLAGESEPGAGLVAPGLAAPEPAAPAAAAGTTEAVASANGVATDASDAQEKKDGATAVAASTLALARVRPSDPIERLITEVERTFAAYVLSNAIDLIVVTGDYAKEFDVATRLEEELEIDSIYFDLGDSFPVTWDGDAESINRSGAPAVGLGLRSIGKGISTFDLRKDEFRFEKRFARLMPALTLLGLQLCVLALLWSSQGYQNLRMHELETTILRDTQWHLCQAFFGYKEPSELSQSATPNFLLAAERKLKEMAGGGSSTGRQKTREYYSPTAIIKEVGEAVARIKPKIYPKYTSFDLSMYLNKSTKSSVTVLVKTMDEAQLISSALKRSKVFEVQDKFDTERDGQVEATFTFHFRESVVDASKRGA